ncbi:MAG: ATPase [Gammaproteobacteria bacterium]
MQMSPKEFLAWPRKAITLLGMSGVGKTHLANRLPQSHWFHYSGDYRIGTKYLEEPILDNVKQQAMQVDFLRDLLRTDSIYIANNITVHNLEPVSTFLGKLGRRDLGGLSLNEFKRRQKLHALAEAAAMRDVEDFIRKARDIYGYDNFLNDAGGSIVELEDQRSIQTLADNTLILYLRAGADMEEELIRRAVTHPKPLYYRDDFLDDRIKAYLKLEKLETTDDINPDHFVSWVFPELVQHRRPLYEAMADEHGYTVDAREITNLESEEDFLTMVADAIREKEAK